MQVPKYKENLMLTIFYGLSNAKVVIVMSNRLKVSSFDSYIDVGSPHGCCDAACN